MVRVGARGNLCPTLISVTNRCFTNVLGQLCQFPPSNGGHFCLQIKMVRSWGGLEEEKWIHPVHRFIPKPLRLKGKECKTPQLMMPSTRRLFQPTHNAQFVLHSSCSAPTHETPSLPSGPPSLVPYVTISTWKSFLSSLIQ